MIDNEDTGLSPQVNAVLAEFFAGQSTDLVNRWVMVVELISEDGKRSTLHLSREDMDSWEIIGMHESASEYARLAMAYNVMGDEDGYDYVDLDEDEE